MKKKNLVNKRVIVSLFISVFLIIAGYFSNNMPLFTGESLEALAAMETMNMTLKFNRENTDSVIFINTSFDKELICYSEIDESLTSPHPDTLGNTEITDRRKLIRLLELLKNVKYKYLVIDLKFAKGLESDSIVIDSVTGDSVRADDKLFSLIKQMDRVVIATHHNIRLIDKELEEKAALADYWTTATSTNFVRYEYFDSIPYIPMVVYNELQKIVGQDTISCYYPFGTKYFKPLAVYTQGNKLCYNSIFLDFEIIGDNYIVQESGHPINKELEYVNLSKDILDEFDPQSIVNNYENHYVFIGNIVQDQHDTYAGPQPGCLILYKALKALNEKKHIVSIIELLILFILYFFISYLILGGNNLLDIFRKSDNALLNFIIDISSFSIVLSLYHFVEYMFGRTSFSFILPIITFTVIKTYILLKKTYNMKKNILVIVLALLSGLLMAFSPLDGERTIKIHSLNSDRIRVDGKFAKPGMMISPESKITFSHPNEWVKLLNTGKTVDIYCENHNRHEEWKKGQYYKKRKSNVKSPNLFWWVTYHTTSSKGAFDNNEYFIGEERPFEIENVILERNRYNQYYEFEVIDGNFKGKKFIAIPDKTDPLIWITRGLLKKNGIILDEEMKRDSLLFKVTFHSFDYTKIIMDSLNIIFIK